MAAEREGANLFLTPAKPLSRKEGEDIFNGLIRRAFEVGTSFSDGVLPGKRIILFMNWVHDILYQRVEFSELSVEGFTEAEDKRFKFDEKRQVHVYEWKQRFELFKERLQKKEERLAHSIQKIPACFSEIDTQAKHAEKAHPYLNVLDLPACADMIFAAKKVLFYAGAGLSAQFLRTAQELSKKYGYPPYGTFNEFIRNYILERPMALVDGCYYQLMLNSPSGEDIEKIKRGVSIIFEKSDDNWFIHFLNIQDKYSTQLIEDHEQIQAIEAILSQSNTSGQNFVEINDRNSIKKLEEISISYGRSNLIDIGLVINFAKLLGTHTNPSPAHQALADLVKLLDMPLVTTNSDPYLEKSGVKPYRLPSGIIAPYWNADTIKQIDMVVLVGCAQVDDFIDLYKLHNPEGIILALNIQPEQYLRESDFLLQGDVQKTLPELYKLIAEKSNAATDRKQGAATASELLAATGQFSPPSELDTAAADSNISSVDQPAYAANG